MEEINTMSSYPTMSPEKERHGFVTFWLWLCIIANIIMIPFSIISYQNLTNLGYYGMDLIASGIDLTPFSEAIHPHVLIMQIVAALSGIAMVVFYIQIKNWKKSGFWGLVITAVTVAIINTIMMNLIQKDYQLVGMYLNLNPIAQVIATPLSLLILWGILQIKKNGVSCWKLLEPTHHNDFPSDSLPMQNGHNRPQRIWLLILICVLTTAATSAIVLFLRHSHNSTENGQYGDRLYTDIYSVIVSGNDIYAVGSTCTGSSETDIPTLWINGQPQAIGNEGNFNKATSVFVAGNDVYVTINESNTNQAFLWKNGESQLLAEGIESEANCVYVDGDDVYVAGQKDGCPTLWKNGVPETLGESGAALTVLVRNNGVYVAGYLGSYFSGEAFLYVFLNNVDVLAYNLEMTQAKSIFVTDDGKVYVAGKVNNNAAVWENGNLKILGEGSAESVAVNNAGTIVVTGITCNPTSSAVVWVNRQFTQVDNVLGYQSMSVVTDGKSFYIGGCSKDGIWAVYEYDGTSAFRTDNLTRVPVRE